MNVPGLETCVSSLSSAAGALADADVGAVAAVVSLACRLVVGCHPGVWSS